MAEADDANDAPALPDDAAKVEESEAEAEAANGDGNTAAAAAAAAAVAVPSLQLDDANDASKKKHATTICSACNNKGHSYAFCPDDTKKKAFVSANGGIWEE